MKPIIFFYICSGALSNFKITNLSGKSLQALLCEWYRFYAVCFDSCVDGHSTLWWMVVGEIWLPYCRKCRKAVFWPALLVPPVHFGAFLYTREQAVAIRW